jgi:hypothetical protein
MTKQENTFPNFYKALCDNEKRPALNYAIIENGRIVLTNGEYMIYSDFGIFVKNHQFAENKVFDRNLLKWMKSRVFYTLVCTEKGVAGLDKKGNFEEMPYSGYIKMIKKTEESTYFSRLLYICQEGKDKEIGVFPNWRACIPDEVVYNKSGGLNVVGISFKLLEIISGCFLYDMEEKILKIEFSDFSRSIRITPRNDYNKFPMQEAILMPVDF